MCWKANTKVAIPHVLHLSPLGHGLWNCGEHHVERVEVEQVPWSLHGCLVHRVHRLLRAHRKIWAWSFENEWLDPTWGIEGASYSIKEGRKIYRSRCSNSEPLLLTAFQLSRQSVKNWAFTDQPSNSQKLRRLFEGSNAPCIFRTSGIQMLCVHRLSAQGCQAIWACLEPISWFCPANISSTRK